MKYNKKQLLTQRRVLQTRMDLRRLLIKADLDALKYFKRSLLINKKEYKEFEREYLELLENYE